MTDNMANLCKKVKDWLSYPLYGITYGQKSVLSVIWGISTECLRGSEQSNMDRLYLLALFESYVGTHLKEDLLISSPP